MNETLEQRALRIWDEVFHTENLGHHNKIIEFARRLIAEQREPVAWITEASLGWLERGSQETYGPSLAFPKRHGNYIVPLYTAPPQDALDAKRYRWLRSVSIHAGDVLPIGFWEKLGDEVDDDFDARIDAAMRGEDI